MTKTKSEKAALNALIQNGKFCKVEYIDNSGKQNRVHGRTGVVRYKKTVKSVPDCITFYDLSSGFINVPKDAIVLVNGLNLRVNHK
jgi:hypothetical protein